MTGDFDSIFKNNKQSIPSDEVMEALKKSIPHNFTIIEDKDKGPILVPIADEHMEMSVTFVKEDMEILKNVPRDKWYTYLYRMQKEIRIEKVSVGDSEKKVDAAHLGQNPLKDNRFIGAMMRTKPFPPPIPFKYETVEGDELEIKMQQVVYDSWSVSKFENVNYLGLSMEIFIDDDNIENSKMTFSFRPHNAESVEEAVKETHFIKGAYQGTLMSDGVVIGGTNAESTIDMDSIVSSIEFWEGAYALQNKLGISFDPAADFPMEDARVFTELVQTMIYGKDIKWEHPYDHFHVGKIVSKELMDNIIGKDDVKYTFIGDDEKYRLLGAEFTVFPVYEMKDFIVTKIEWDDDEDSAAEIHIEDVENKKWILVKKYMTLKEVEEFRNKG